MVDETTYPHLTPQAAAEAARPAGERVVRLAGHCWIGYPAAQAAIARLEALFAQPPVLRPPNLLIVGPTNNGKSMIAERFRRAHPATPAPDREHELIPVVAMQMPSSATVRRFYAALLAAMGSPMVATGSTDAREQMALRIMRQVRVRVLIIDELHNLLAGRSGQQREFLNLLRFIGNELRIPLVGLGTKEAYLAIRSDDQLENPFEPLALPRWTDGVELGRLLVSFEATLPLREPSELGAPPLRGLILGRSEGTIGEISSLLVAAARTALAAGRERIDAETIEAAGLSLPDRAAAAVRGLAWLMALASRLHAGHYTRSRGRTSRCTGGWCGWRRPTACPTPRFASRRWD